MEVDAAKLLGAGLAVLGVIGPGVGIGLIFASFNEGEACRCGWRPFWCRSKSFRTSPAH